MSEGFVLVGPYILVAMLFSLFLFSLSFSQMREFGRYHEQLFTTNEFVSMGHQSALGESVGPTEGELDPKSRRAA